MKIPLKYRATITKERLTVAIIISWFLSFAIGLVVIFGVGFEFWQPTYKNRVYVYDPSLPTANRTNNNSIVSPYGINDPSVNVQNGTLVPIAPTSLCQILAALGLDSKGLITALCSLLCTTLMISSYSCVCCRVKRLQNRTGRLTGVQTSSRKTIITTSFIVGSFC